MALAATAAPAARQSLHADPWLLLLVAAVLLLAFEWWSWNRRVTL
jgi:hypothetical protein